MIRLEQAVSKVSEDLGVSKSLVKKVLSLTFKEIESNLKDGDNFMFKGYVKFVQSKNNKKPISKTEIFNLKTKDK
tara:strand:+ start:842 stop:1066 length:225 start_codon:yes stop_codon:yes gene_type:complete